MSTRARLIKVYGQTHSARETAMLLARLLGLDGGPGSGNFGHSGRPGKVGGSAKGSGGSALRSGSKETGYSSFTKHETFNAIVSNAKRSSSYKEFIRNMNDVQRDALRQQRIECGSSESMQKYAERIYNMLSQRSAKPEVRQQNKPVDGKDISMTWEYKGESQGQGGSTKAIDTDIEDVLHQQGFDGIPKVVSQAEFDRIVKEHPDMPILMRSYAASTPEELKSFDQDLEKGWFYVDCGNGGAQYGQGMYCAGVYPEDPVKEWDEVELDPGGWTVLTIRGEGYKARQAPGVEFQTPTDLIADYPYIIVDQDGKKHLVRQDSDSTLYENLGEGGLYDEKELEKLMQGSRIYECIETDIDAYAKSEEETRKKRMDGALEEMRHYRSVSISRIEDETTGKPPEGKFGASGYDREGTNFYYYYDKKDVHDMKKEKPPEGEMVALINKQFGTSLPATIAVAREDGTLILLDGSGIGGEALKDYDWAPLEGECPKPEIDPKATTRMMTLDPSARIITHRELRDIQGKAEDIRHDGREQIFVNEIRRFKDEPMGAFNLYNVMMGRGTAGLSDEEIQQTAKFRDENPDKVKEIEEFVAQQNELKKQYEEEARKYDRFTHMDCGVLAALLGYDAINAEGHGMSGSYTVVLNRTKVIISEDAVDVRG